MHPYASETGGVQSFVGGQAPSFHAHYTRYHICGVINRACSSRLTHLRMALQAESAAARLARGERATYSSTSLSPHAVVV